MFNVLPNEIWDLCNWKAEVNFYNNYNDYCIYIDQEIYSFGQPSKLINVPDPTTVIFFPCFILYNNLIKEALLINLQSEPKHKMINLFKVPEWTVSRAEFKGRPLPLNTMWYLLPAMYRGKQIYIHISSVQSLSRVQSLWPLGLQHTRSPCPSPTPRVYSNSCPSSRWYHPTISSSIVPPSPGFNLFQTQGLFKWVSSLHQVAKVLKFQLQHQSFQWIFRTDFL